MRWPAESRGTTDECRTSTSSPGKTRMKARRRKRRVVDEPVRRAVFCSSLFGAGGIDHRSDLGDRVCREAAFRGVLADHVLVRSDVYAVDLVVRHERLHPLDLWTELLQNAARCL